MSTAGSFPLTLRIAGRKVVVVGGGHVATRRAHALVEAGADLTVISPTLTARLTELAEQGRITWEQRSYEDGRPPPMPPPTTASQLTPRLGRSGA